jgi:hypothetical protein
MDAKHRTVQILGFVALVFGALFNVLLIRALLLGRMAGGWFGIDALLAFGVAFYFLSLGVRGLRWTKGQGIGGVPKVKWGRVLLGAIIINSSIDTTLHPAANMFQASNDAQAAGMKFAAVTIGLFGVWLIVSGILARFKARPQNAQVTEISP